MALSKQLTGLRSSCVVINYFDRQLNTPWSDGVAGLAQKPIPSKKEFLYKWTANEYGTYWYHSHYKSQVSDGFFGPSMYIRGWKPFLCNLRHYLTFSAPSLRSASFVSGQAVQSDQ